jgi:hypothetical protein
VPGPLAVPLLASAIGLALLFGVAYGDLVAGDPPTRRSPAIGSKWNPPGVRVSGRLSGLYPGGVETLWATVENRTRRRRVVRAIRVAVRDATAVCPARSLRIEANRRRLVLPPQQRRLVPLAIEMRPAAADGCQGAVFPLSFHVKVKR